jgi:uncharacterized protein YqfB (UPF0267 family)
MVAYSFKAQFAEPILAGTKGGTIRADRRRHARPGEELQLYTAMRTKQCRLVARKECLAVVSIMLDFRRRIFTLDDASFVGMEPAELDALARFDGFASFDEMASFWTDVDHFEGWHIRWLPLPADLEGAS